MKFKNRYTSVACNRTTEALDWGQDGLIYYGACHSIAVFDPKFHGSAKIIRTLTGHKARVNTVKKLHNVPQSSSGAVDLASGSDDSNCMLWNSRDSENPLRYTLKGHTKGVTQVEAFYTEGGLVVATGSADSTVKLWKLDGEDFACFQTINLKTGYCFALKFFQLPGSGSVMLACAMDNDLINLYAMAGEEYVLVEKLKGHTDWVRGLDCVLEGNDVLLASASQDSFIRLWRIAKREQLQTQRSFEEFSVDEDIVLEERIFSVSVDGTQFHYALALESVLQGHEGWVYGVHFNRQGDKLNLLSSSIDKTLTIWTPSESGVWFESVRVGEVGGASLGFYGGKFAPDGRSIIGHGLQGSLHLWNQDADNGSVWKPGTIIGGHFEAVRDLAWDPEGRFVMTVSADQTTRVHAAWPRSAVTGGDDEAVTWHEIARPQVHGYDMQCLCLLSRYRFASGAEEKIVRIFQAPVNFVENLRQLCEVGDDPEGEDILKTTPKGASVPSLGLSNKAVYNVEEESASKHVKDIYPEHYFTPMKLDAPPVEETLMQNTLWPEMQKLYGHGYEIYALASTRDGRFIASASRATSLEHARILIWNTASWKILQKLEAHQLTVTQLAFSSDGRSLLAVSRDRTLSVFENKADSQAAGACDFQLVTHTDKHTSVHARIIWCCDWSHDSVHFASGSRDGKVVLWERKESQQYGACGVLELKGESVTAVAFGRRKVEDDRYLVAVGLERGAILLYGVLRQDWKLLATIDESCGHHLTVKRLAFKPSDDELQLASCGEDNFVRVYDLC